MRLPGIVLGVVLFAVPAAAQFIDRDAVFARAREIAAAALPGVESADLAPFQIAYDLTLLETGNPAGGFEVALLLRSSREVLAAQEVIAAAAEYSTLLLNRDPDAGSAGVSLPLAPGPQSIDRSTP